VSDPRKAPAARALTCPRCGALNSPEFGKCIRCASALPRDGEAVAASAPSARPRPGRADEGAGEHHYWATKTLVWATLVIFAGQVLASIERGTGLPIVSGIHPADAMRFGAMEIDIDVVRQEPFRLLSYMFVHGGLIHFGLNMMGFVNFGRVAEPAIGTARFAIVYVLSGLAGAVATLAVSVVTGPGGRTVGASGAIFGVMGLVLGLLIRRRNPAWKSFALEAVLYSVMFGFFVNAAGTGVVINNSAHIGGLVCGVLFGLVYGNPSGSRPSVAANIFAGVCLLACLASLILSQFSPRWRALDRSLDQGASLGAPAPGALPASSPMFVAPPSNRSIAPRGPTV
jgi:membrane associated rhomboid family serine protease